MKPVDVKSSIYINSKKEIKYEGSVKIVDLKLVILLEYQNTKTFLKKAVFQIGLKKFLLLQKLKKILFRGHMLLMILKAKKLLERFTKKNRKKQIK